MRTGVVIVGGGLAGLQAAHLVHKAGVDFLLLEGRERLGGRILSVDAKGQPSSDGFDLGPSWFWPGMQPHMADLVRALNLPTFPQTSDGDVIIHRMSREAPQRYRGMGQEPQSMRFAGGTGALVAALARCLPEANVRLGTRVTGLSLAAQGVELAFVNAAGGESRVEASHAILALPPRLLEATVSFAPALDAPTTALWRGTPTWMAPHAKFFALYDRPFWREAGLSGTAQSMVGPLVEIHDATTASGHAALFGFLGVPAGQRATVGRDALASACVQQLAILFGTDAATPQATLFKDWAADPLTATAEDAATGGHPSAQGQPWVGGEWRARLSLAGSETSLTEPGYLAGAIEAAERASREAIAAVKAVLQRE